MSGSVSFDNISRLMRTSESFSDLNAELNPGSCNKSRGASTNASMAAAGVGGPPAPPSANSAKANQEDSATNKPFGLGKRIFPLSRSLVQLLSSCDENSALLLQIFFFSCQFSKLFYLHYFATTVHN